MIYNFINPRLKKRFNVNGDIRKKHSITKRLAKEKIVTQWNSH